VKVLKDTISAKQQNLKQPEPADANGMEPDGQRVAEVSRESKGIGKHLKGKIWKGTGKTEADSDRLTKTLPCIKGMRTREEKGTTLAKALASVGILAVNSWQARGVSWPWER